VQFASRAVGTDKCNVVSEVRQKREHF
jgi:hypothetical protein